MRAAFTEDFDGDALDRAVWVPHYLPQWSSRAASAAAYAIGGSELSLTSPPGHGLWCAGDHEPPLRVSGIQSGVFSGPVGSTVGQQPYREGLVVREHQPAMRGWTPHGGRIEVRARMDLSPRSMASVWFVGFEDAPERSGEICVFEVFGDALEEGSAVVGMGVHPFRDPALTDDFAVTRLPIDVREHHVFAADWRPGRVELSVDGDVVRVVEQAPDYPMQAEVAVFDFPAHPDAAAHAGHVPALVVDRISGVPRRPDRARGPRARS